MPYKILNTKEAVGMAAAHDMTKIVKGKFKGPAFRRGNVITEDDVGELLKMGKDRVYVLDLADGEVHEDEASVRLSQAAAGQGIICSSPKESRVNFHAAHDGLVKINTSALADLNEIEDLMFATIPNNIPVQKGEMVAGTRFIPLVVREETVRAAEDICRTAGSIIKVRPFMPLKVGIVVTGNEVFHGRIQDDFGPTLQAKMEAFGAEVMATGYAPDDPATIAGLIRGAVECGARLVLVSGGMSVDPDDVTRHGIALSGAKVEKYGAPVLPGAMFLLAYLGDVPVLGIPACGVYYRTTVLDLVLPRLMAGERLTRRDIVALGHGGLCRLCPECRYPRCSFGLAGHCG